MAEAERAVRSRAGGLAICTKGYRLWIEVRRAVGMTWRCQLIYSRDFQPRVCNRNGLFPGSTFLLDRGVLGGILADRIESPSWWENSHDQEPQTPVVLQYSLWVIFAALWNEIYIVQSPDSYSTLVPLSLCVPLHRVLFSCWLPQFKFAATRP